MRYTSALNYLEKNDIIEESVPDYLYCYLIGMGKRLINRLLNTLSAESYNYLDYLDYYILKKMKGPCQISRLPRSLTSIGR